MSFTRICPNPECGKIITHTLKGNCAKATKKNRLCMSCSKKKFFEDNPERKQDFRNRLGDTFGENNPFYGKQHSKETREHLAKKSLDYYNNLTEEQRGEIKNRLPSKSGEDNGMFGRTPYDIWLEKYGKEEADKRQKEMKENHLKNQLRGEDNPWFGKAPPNGTGNGWKSWYNGFYCRSLRELGFLIDLDSKGIAWEGAENIRIKYTFQGKESTYAPDFLVGNKLYEIKPQSLIDRSQLVAAKAEAGRKYCAENGLEYILTDVEPNFQKIKELYDQGIVIFDKRYIDKFLAYFN